MYTRYIYIYIFFFYFFLTLRFKLLGGMGGRSANLAGACQVSSDIVSSLLRKRCLSMSKSLQRTVCISWQQCNQFHAFSHIQAHFETQAQKDAKVCKASFVRSELQN